MQEPYLPPWLNCHVSYFQKKSRVGQYAFKKYHEIQTDSITLSLDAVKKTKQAEAGVLLRHPVDLYKRARICVMGIFAPLPLNKESSDQFL